MPAAPMGKLTSEESSLASPDLSRSASRSSSLDSVFQ